MLNALGFTLEHIEKDAVIKNGKKHSLMQYALCYDEYREMKVTGRFIMDYLLSEFVASIMASRRLKKNT